MKIVLIPDDDRTAVTYGKIIASSVCIQIIVFTEPKLKCNRRRFMIKYVCQYDTSFCHNAHENE